MILYIYTYVKHVNLYPQVLARDLGGCTVDPKRWVYIQLPAVST